MTRLVAYLQQVKRSVLVLNCSKRLKTKQSSLFQFSLSLSLRLAFDLFPSLPLSNLIAKSKIVTKSRLPLVANFCLKKVKLKKFGLNN